MYRHATRVYELNQTKWGLCKVRMRTADADGGCGRRTDKKKKIIFFVNKNENYGVARDIFTPTLADGLQ